ncbi:MAG: hypothetical protein JSR73_11195 [Proteobacteria bacterium]|nr:hypothetical protein [Pseudomonadota bacterium]
MPELHLVLTDLAAPDADDGAGLARLPLGERLLARADRIPASADWRRWVLTRAGREPPPGDLPLGRALAAARGLDLDRQWFVASPLQLVAGLTRVHFDARGPLTLAPAALAALAARFQADWPAATAVLETAGGGLVLGLPDPLAVETRDPATVAGRELSVARPRGADAGRLERLMTELQMWLHGAGLAAADGRVVNALWLWGGGVTPVAGGGAAPAFAGDDAPLAALLAAPAAADAPRLELRSVAALLADGGFEAADERWFQPLAAALAGGRHALVRVHAAGREFVLRPGQRWRLWRRPRPWWELLG